MNCGRLNELDWSVCPYCAVERKVGPVPIGGGEVSQQTTAVPRLTTATGTDSP
jgi:hypothetical protein